MRVPWPKQRSAQTGTAAEAYLGDKGRESQTAVKLAPDKLEERPLLSACPRFGPRAHADGELAGLQRLRKLIGSSQP